MLQSIRAKVRLRTRLRNLFKMRKSPRFRNRLQNNYKIWKEQLPEDLKWWDSLISGTDSQLQEWHKMFRKIAFDPNTPLQDFIRDLITVPPGSKVRILDVGAGPATFLGTVLEGYDLEIVAIDPQANDFNQVLERNGLIPPIRTQTGEVEHLSDLFESESFDLVTCRNALDHSYDPVQGISEAITVLKPGGSIFLRHYPNEAEANNYNQLHQWNFKMEDGEFVVWNLKKKIVVSHAVQGIASIEGKLVPDESLGNEAFWLDIIIKKV